MIKQGIKPSKFIKLTSNATEAIKEKQSQPSKNKINKIY